MSLSNNPPADADPLMDRLIEQHAALALRTDELLAAVERVPAKIDDDAVVEKATSFVKQIKAHAKSVETTRVAEKEPYLAGSRTVDAYFAKLGDQLKKAAQAVESRIGAYLREKEAAERRRREEEARKAREEAEARAAAMREQSDMDAALQAEEDARRAQKAAEVKAADLARTRGTLGGVATLRTSWVGELSDRKALDLEALRPLFTDDALNAAIRAAVKAGVRELKGARIFEHKTAMVA